MVGLAAYIWMRFVWQESPAKERWEESYDTILFAAVVLLWLYFAPSSRTRKLLPIVFVQGYLCHPVCFVSPTCHIDGTGRLAQEGLCDLLVLSS